MNNITDNYNLIIENTFNFPPEFGKDIIHQGNFKTFYDAMHFCVDFIDKMPAERLEKFDKAFFRIENQNNILLSGHIWSDGNYTLYPREKKF
jgi:hypothetical protein